MLLSHLRCSYNRVGLVISFIIGCRQVKSFSRQLKLCYLVFKVARLQRHETFYQRENALYIVFVIRSVVVFTGVTLAYLVIIWLILRGIFSGKINLLKPLSVVYNFLFFFLMICSDRFRPSRLEPSTCFSSWNEASRQIGPQFWSKN